MANKAKNKGRYFEHLIANKLTELGIPSKRIPMSGMLRGCGDDLDGDVVIDQDKEKIECKFHANMKKELWNWLESNDYLAIKRNNKEPLIVMTLDKFMKLYKKDHRGAP